MLKNESNIWDRKYEKTRVYNSKDDYFRFSNVNPTIIALRPHIKNGMNILEVGSGTGELISFLQYNYPDIRTFGLDFSSVSISNSTKITKNFNLPVEFMQSDISKIPFENEHFDIVFGDQVLAHLDNIENALKEIFRVTKKGGIVAFTSANKLRPDGWYLYKRLSKNHEGYKQESFYPWELSRILEKNGFERQKYYGELVFLSRSLNLLRNIIFKKGDDKTQKESSLLNSKNNEKISLFKKIYYYIEKIFPNYLKITIGVLARK